jgi:hypothetical protein
MAESSRIAVYTTLFVVSFDIVTGANTDLFNFGYTTFDDGRTNYGQPNWGAITCEDPQTCVRIVTLKNWNWIGFFFASNNLILTTQ